MIDLQGINENFQFWQSQFWQYDWISTISLLFGGNSQMNNNSINLITFLSNDFRKLNTTIYPIFFAINERNCSCLFCEIPEWIISLSISSHFLEMISANKLNITTYPIFFFPLMSAIAVVCFAKIPEWIVTTICNLTYNFFLEPRLKVATVINIIHSFKKVLVLGYKSISSYWGSLREKVLVNYKKWNLNWLFTW